MLRKKNQTDPLQFVFEPMPLEKGKKALQDMSLIQGQYQEYLVVKTGYLVAILEGSGLNLDLLSEYEQTDVFEEYNSFLMSNVAESKNDFFQFLDMTVPVNLKPYLNSWKARYLDAKEQQPDNKVLHNLIASYVDKFEKEEANHDMSTQSHYIVVRQKIKDKTYKALQFAEKNLNEQTQNIKRALEDQFQDYNLNVKKLNGEECKDVLYLFTNYNRA